MSALILAMAGGIGVLLTAAPGAELALKLIGSAYLIYLAFRIASSQGITRTVVSRPLGVLHGAAFQFANPKGWLFAFAAVGTFLPRDLAPMPGALAGARSGRSTSPSPSSSPRRWPSSGSSAPTRHRDTAGPVASGR